MLYIDSKGSKCIVTAAEDEYKQKINPKYPACFLCTVVEDKSEAGTALSTATVTTGDCINSFGLAGMMKLAVNSHVSAEDQLASVKHYDALERDRVSRRDGGDWHIRRVSLSGEVFDIFCVAAAGKASHCSNLPPAEPEQLDQVGPHPRGCRLPARTDEWSARAGSGVRAGRGHRQVAQVRRRRWVGVL